MKRIIFAILFSLVSFLLTSYKTEEPEGISRQQLLEIARTCLRQSDSIQQKTSVAQLLRTLEQSEYLLQQINEESRTPFVLTQSCIEEALAYAHAKGDVVNLVGVIHTSMPAAPLCVKANPLDKSLLHEIVRTQNLKKLIVQSRARNVRNYLENGATLYVAYPRGGFEKRNPQQQMVYAEELHNHPRLIDWVLCTERMKPELIGATYFFQNKKGENFVFSVQARQANEDEDKMEWGLWFGEIENPAIAHRVSTLIDYMKICHGPPENKLIFSQGARQNKVDVLAAPKPRA